MKKMVIKLPKEVAETIREIANDQKVSVSEIIYILIKDGTKYGLLKQAGLIKEDE